MKRFKYVIINPDGLEIHLASQMVRTAMALDSAIAVHKLGGGSAVATNLMALIGMGLKEGDTVEVTVGFGNEDANAGIMEQFFKDNL